MLYIKNLKFVRELGDLIDDDVMTGFQLKDILNELVSYEQIKKKLQEQLIMNKKIRDGNIFDYLFEIRSQNDEREKELKIKEEEIEKLI